MATLSAAGIGSGLDVKSIVSQLVALEKQPIVALQTKEASIQTRISSFSQIKSLVSTLSDAASKLTLDSGWSSMAVTSSNAGAANATVSGLATAGNYSIAISKLAQGQTSISTSVTSGATLGTGSLSIQVGTADPIEVDLVGGDDTSLTGIAAKINDAGAGVTASVISDASGQRLMLRSSTTGATTGFTVTGTTTGAGTATSDLSTLAYTVSQPAQDTEATINNVPITSATRSFADTIPGLTFTASSVTTAPVEISVTADTATTTKNIQAFVDAYNAVNDLLSSSVKYDADSKAAGSLQGDSTAVGLQNSLRSLMGTSTRGGLYSVLSEVGISIQRGGNLAVDSTKLASALSTSAGQANVKKLFATKDSGSDATNGMAVKFKALTTSLLSFSGTFNTKSDALAADDKRNLAEQDKVTARAAVVEARLNAQYSALDTRMASLTSLNTYITQQITNWNKSTS